MKWPVWVDTALLLIVEDDGSLRCETSHRDVRPNEESRCYAYPPYKPEVYSQVQPRLNGRGLEPVRDGRYR